jgi:hypothetical protein
MVTGFSWLALERSSSSSNPWSVMRSTPRPASVAVAARFEVDLHQLRAAQRQHIERCQHRGVAAVEVAIPKACQDIAGKSSSTHASQGELID